MWEKLKIMETKTCQNCKKDFVIETEDFNFYEKINVPPPTWCPECRTIRRLSFSNIWNLTWHNCDKCGERTLSMFSPGQKMPVYCQPCWWSDSWDGTEYAMDYDPSRPFLEQIKELTEKTPYTALSTEYLTNKNSGYSNNLAWSKNCYLTFWADFCENVYFSSILNKAKETADSLRIFSSELCYESIGLRKGCYRGFYSQECNSCTDIWFSRNCYGCMNCVGCVNLRGSSYRIFNVQYTREEYFKKLEEFKLATRSGINTLEKEAEIFWQKFPYRSFTGDTFNVNVTGEYLYQSRNSKDIYIASHAENCKYCQFITFKPAKDCMDYSGWGNNATQIYESYIVGENANAISFCFECWPDVLNLQYCMWNIAGKNNFGCVNLKRKSYCILNKQYTKEAYEKLREKIIAGMKVNPYTDKLGRKFFYGEFFPAELSKFSYNNSTAYKFFPKTKEEILALGYTWNDETEQLGEATISGKDLPETIAETDASILKELIACATCNRKYKIASLEFDLLRKMNLPLPTRCLKCRENSRFAKLQMPKLYDRLCAKCGKPIRTSNSPDRPEIIYCEKCYQGEFA